MTTITTLTPEQIDALGLDALRVEVAKALGCTWDDETITLTPPYRSVYARFVMRAHGTPHVEREDQLLSVLPDYPRDIAAAWALVEWLTKRFNYETIPVRLDVDTHDVVCEVAIALGVYDDPGARALYTAEGDTAPVAICRAFLKAIYDTGDASVRSTKTSV